MGIEIVNMYIKIGVLRDPKEEKKRKLRNTREISKLGEEKRKLVSSIPSRNRILVIAAKNYAKLDLKVFCSCPISLDFFTLSH